MSSVLVTGDTTITGVVRSLQKTLDAGGHQWSVVESDFNAWRREVIDPHSAFNRVRPDYLVYVLSPRMLTELPDCRRECTSLIEDLRGFAGYAQVLCTTAAVDPIHPMPLSETLQLQQRACEINSLLLDFMQEHSWFHLLDQTAILAMHGVTALTDSRFEILGRMYYSPKGAAILARSISRVLGALTKPAKKVLLLDLDQSLWRGTLGEDGLSGIGMGDEGLSYAFRLFQRALRVLKANGVLLTICSKNDEDHALQALSSHPDMLLTLEDFVAYRINWRPKSENIVSIADELGLGLDSLVLFDDSPFERESIRRMLPLVDVLDVPSDPADYVRCLWEYSGFDRLRTTQEDRSRSETYQQEANRRALLKQSTSLAEFYSSLNMVANISELRENDVERVHQLVSKTNQFNLTLKRYSEPEIRQMKARTDVAILTLRLRDRLGENGLVAVVIVKKSNAYWEIDNFLMSCRVIGRTVEYGLVRHIAEMARAAGVPLLIASFVSGSRNRVAAEFLSRAGFAWEDTLGKWTLSVDDLEEKVPFCYTTIEQSA